MSKWETDEPTLEWVRGVEEHPAGRVRAGKERRVGAEVRRRGKVRAESRAVALGDEDGRDRDRGVRSRDMSEQALGDVVRDDDADRARVLGVLDLDREVAGSAVDQRDLAGHAVRS